MDAAAAVGEQSPPPQQRWRRIRRIRKTSLLQPKQQTVMADEEGDFLTPTAISTRKRFAMEVDIADDGIVSEEKTDENVELSERRKALFEPLEPNMNGKRSSAESLLPPPDFDSASYPKGWLIGKKRKLVNVDVVESMRRIAVQEMNRKDREINGLNKQLEEDSRVLEHLQIQLLEEKSKRTTVERENVMLQDQINMLMDMLHDNENMADDVSSEP